MTSKKAYQQLLRNGWLPNQDFVFVSYSSRNWEQVYPCVAALRDRGINVYIDIEFMENQSAGWLENFQSKLFTGSGCRGIVAFLSMDYMRSYACLMEQLANRTYRMRKRMGKPLPVFYVALDPALCTVQQMLAHIHEDSVRQESVRERVEMAPPECQVLKDLILDSRFPRYTSESAVQKLLDDIRDKHDVVTTMYELIFEDARDMPGILAFEGAEECAQLLADNFINDKNTSIKMQALEELKRAYQDAAPEEPPAGPPAEGPRQEAAPAAERPIETEPAEQDPPLQQLLDQNEAAERGDADAQFTLGTYHLMQEGGNRDPEQAVRWFRQAAEQGHADAQYLLAHCYLSGDGVGRDPEQAVHWFTLAAQQGHADAQFALGTRYLSGEGVERSPEQAAHWYALAAEQGHDAAQYDLAFCYVKGIGVEDRKSVV